jgi:hypothetical protein
VGGEAVDAIAWRAGEIAHRSPGQPVLPLREEVGNGMVAWPELRHAFAHRFDHAGAVGHAERWEGGHRVRDVEEGPDGSLWMLEDANPGALIHVTPKNNTSN